MVALPLNCAFFGGIDLGRLRNFAEKKAFDVIEQEILGIRVREIKAVMIDDLTLFLQPATPAGLANLIGDSLSELVGKGGKSNRRTFLAAMYALNVIGHVEIIEVQF